MKATNDDNKKQTDILKHFGKIWNLKGDSEDIPEEQRKGFMDPSNCLMIVPKKVWVKNAITDTYDVEEGKVPELDYKGKAGVLNECKYIPMFLQTVLEMTKHSEVVIFRMLRDYPLSVETEDMICIIAPRVEND